MNDYTVTLEVKGISKDVVEDWLLRQLMGEANNVEWVSYEVDGPHI